MRSISFAQFVTTDIAQDRAGQMALRLTFVCAAIDAALRGNATQYDAAVTAGTGKTDRAKAYAAGFKAVPRPAKFDYKGKLTQATADAIAAQAEELTAAFSAAFLAILPLEAVKVADDVKAARKAKAAATAKAKALEVAKAAGYVPAADAVPAVNLQAMGPAAIADAVASLIATGQLSADNVAVILSAAVESLPDAVRTAAGSLFKPAKAPKAAKAATAPAGPVKDIAGEKVPQAMIDAAAGRDATAENAARADATAHNAV